MSIRIEFTVYRKNGRRAGTSRTDRILDLDAQACGAPTPCLSSDGLTVPQANFINRNLIWTKAHTLIFRDADPGGGPVLREILDPATETLSGLEITGIQNEFDTSN